MHHFLSLFLYACLLITSLQMNIHIYIFFGNSHAGNSAKWVFKFCITCGQRLTVDCCHEFPVFGPRVQWWLCLVMPTVSVQEKQEKRWSRWRHSWSVVGKLKKIFKGLKTTLDTISTKNNTSLVILVIYSSRVTQNWNTHCILLSLVLRVYWVRFCTAAKHSLPQEYFCWVQHHSSSWHIMILWELTRATTHVGYYTMWIWYLNLLLS